uniref:Uncharacterized protein n=1 Tax=Leclercia adecarboxylata TaxID=83655 RepID=A0A6H0A408_9ENTR|nr:hypothetical protein [Leclercia adecarboxylata]
MYLYSVYRYLKYENRSSTSLPDLIIIGRREKKFRLKFVCLIKKISSRSLAVT